ncbi:MAG: indole-3-glycerol-phosphate synthase [Candidatus Helarchaeota archaeon]
MNILDEIVQKRSISINNIKRKYSQPKFIPNEKNLFHDSIKRNKNISIISELKFASPSMGDIRENVTIIDLIKEMETGGAIGLSILTEPEFFKGSPDFIPAIKKVTNLPILMKDFFIHESQLNFAADIGANMVLLIASVLNKGEISRFLKINEKLNLESLVEIHDETDIEKIRGFNLKIVGINNRNLTNFSIDLKNTEKLAPILRKEFPNCMIISESGIKSRTDVERVQAAGANAVLVGTYIMQSPRIASTIQELRGVKND